MQCKVQWKSSWNSDTLYFLQFEDVLTMTTMTTTMDSLLMLFPSHDSFRCSFDRQKRTTTIIIIIIMSFFCAYIFPSVCSSCSSHSGGSELSWTTRSRRRRKKCIKNYSIANRGLGVLISTVFMFYSTCWMRATLSSDSHTLDTSIRIRNTEFHRWFYGASRWSKTTNENYEENIQCSMI